jgi:hypothetical protein
VIILFCDVNGRRVVIDPRLLLACVGISCSIGTEDSETDQMLGWRSLDWNPEGITTLVYSGSKEVRWLSA